MTLYRANFDYESELFWDKSDTWITEILEHLFFYCVGREDSLFTSRTYSDDYFNFIKLATGFVPRLTSEGESKNWWGKLENLSLEKKLNSKVTSFEIGKKLGLNHSNSALLKNYQELENFLEQNKDIFIRHPFERSGRASFRLKNIDELEKNKEKFSELLEDQPFIGDLYFNRHWDLGTGFIQRDDKFEIEYQIKNLNDNRGVFRGAVLIQNPIETVELKKIAEAYYDLGARDYLQVDSFAYEAGINWLCEVNYRKTMGYVLNKLKRLCPPGQSVALLMTPKSWIKKYRTHSELVEALDDIEGVFPLSPVNNNFHCWLVSAESREELLGIAKEWWGVVAKNSNEFPTAYTEILADDKTPVMGSPI